MERRTSPPRGLISRSVLAAALFAASVVPGWTLGGLAERWTGSAVLNWLITLGWSATAIQVLAPSASYRRRDAWMGLVPLLGWYVLCVLAWRVALWPYRDWDPRDDELWRARWLTGDLIGLWRVDGPEPVRAGRLPAAGHRTS